MNDLEFTDKYDELILKQASELYGLVNMGKRDPENLKIALGKSFCSIFCLKRDKLIGLGRVISDGIYYASIFDVAIRPEYQGKGIGKQIMKNLINSVPGTNIHLTSTFGNESFY